MITKQVVPVFHTLPLFHGVFWVGLLFLLLVVFGLLVWRRYLLRILAIVSILTTVAVAVAIPATWNNWLIVTLSWNVPQANGDLFQLSSSIIANRGGVEFCTSKYRALTANTLPADYDASRRNDPPSLLWHIVPSSSQYPEITYGIGFTGGLKFLENKLGFLFGWKSAPIPGDSNLLFVAVLIMPQWIILLFCPWAPLFLWRRWSKRRDRGKHGLCLKCGFDLRAHNPGDKCPSCGALVPVSAISPKSAPDAKTPPI